MSCFDMLRLDSSRSTNFCNEVSTNWSFYQRQSVTICLSNPRVAIICIRWLMVASAATDSLLCISGQVLNSFTTRSHILFLNGLVKSTWICTLPTTCHGWASISHWCNNTLIHSLNMRCHQMCIQLHLL